MLEKHLTHSTQKAVAIIAKSDDEVLYLIARG